MLQSERLQKAWRREHTRFKHDYNDKLYNGLVLLLLVDILMFRFVIKFSVLESLGWVVFLFLQVWLVIDGAFDFSAWLPVVRPEKLLAHCKCQLQMAAFVTITLVFCLFCTQECMETQFHNCVAAHKHLNC